MDKFLEGYKAGLESVKIQLNIGATITIEKLSDMQRDAEILFNTLEKVLSTKK